MLKERNIYIACSCNYSRKGTGRLSTLVSKFQLCQAVTVTIKQTNLFQIACSMHPIRKIYETLHVCEEISKLKYSFVCYTSLTSFRTLNGGVVRRVSIFFTTLRKKDEQGQQKRAGHYDLLRGVRCQVYSIGDFVAVRAGKSKWYMAIISELDNDTKELKSMSTIIHKCSVPCMDGCMRYSFGAVDIKNIWEKLV